MIEKGQILNFNPPKLDGNVVSDKRRYMVITNDNEKLEMINISSLKGKERKLMFSGNVKLYNREPFLAPSFARVDTVYKTEYFPKLEEFISFGGEKLNKEDFNNILLERERYITRTKNVNEINFTKEEFINKNKETVQV